MSFPRWSLSARRAWIEIIDYIIDYVNDAVALRKESVDRNIPVLGRGLFWTVALRKESVDRNPNNPMIRINEIPSLSARRAWIEIIEEVSKYVVKDVALRKESVDRNSWWLLA